MRVGLDGIVGSVGKGNSAVVADATAVARKLTASVLVVDDDPSLGHALVCSLCEHGYHASSVTSFEQALDRVREHHYGVLLTDLHMQGGDGMDLIQALREASPGTRPVLMSAHATAREGQRALDLGAVRVLCKPFEVDEMLHAVERAAEYSGGFWASVHGLSLVDTLQMLHLARRSVSVRFLGGARAVLHMQDGELVHAEFGELCGEAALAAILNMPAGALQTFAPEAVPRTIFEEFQALLLDQLCQLDEKERDSKRPQAQHAFDDFADLDEPEPASAALVKTATRESAISGARMAVRVPPPRPTVEKLDIACERLVNVVDGAVACAVIELSSGSLLGMHERPGTSLDHDDIRAAAALDLFRGRNGSRIEALLHEPGASQEGPAFEEVQLTSRLAQHFAKALKDGQAVVLLVTGRSTSLGMGWAQLRSAMPAFERLLA